METTQQKKAELMAHLLFICLKTRLQFLKQAEEVPPTAPSTETEPRSHLHTATLCLYMMTDITMIREQANLSLRDIGTNIVEWSRVTAIVESFIQSHK